MNLAYRLTNASLSTMWAIKNYPDMNDFLEVSKRLGFQKIELNHQVDSKMLSHAKLDHYQFSSIHEPCPADVSMGELVNRDWLISSSDDESRRHGVEAVKKSILLAHDLQAHTVVVHCGTMPNNFHYESRLRKLFINGQHTSDEYDGIKAQIIQLRSELAGPHLISVKRSLYELLDYADQLNVSIGLENRYHYMDIPSIDEMKELLNLADPAHLGFIYDVGHAQALDLLGFYPHQEWLNQFSSRMFGTHLHDVIGLTDHYAPGLGDIDFYKIAPYLPETAFRTFELLPGNTLAQIMAGIEHLLNAGCIKYL